MSGILAVVLSLAVLAALVIGGAGAWIVVKRPQERRKGLLMLAVCGVTLVNVWLISAPLP